MKESDGDLVLLQILLDGLSYWTFPGSGSSGDFDDCCVFHGPFDHF